MIKSQKIMALRVGGAVVKFRICKAKTKTREVVRISRRSVPLMINPVLSDKALSKTIVSVSANQIIMIRTRTTLLATF